MSELDVALKELERAYREVRRLRGLLVPFASRSRLFMAMSTLASVGSWFAVIASLQTSVVLRLWATGCAFVVCILNLLVVVELRRLESKVTPS